MKKIIIALMFLLNANFVFAHEKQLITIGDKDYLFVIGSLNESVIVGDKSGLDMSIYLPDVKDSLNSKATNSIPVLGLEKDLKLEMLSGNLIEPFDLTAAWGKPGNYNSIFYPTNSSEFSYRISGKLNNQDINLTFTCSKLGHVMKNMDVKDHSQMKMSNGNFTVKDMSGSFGCPKDKENFLFPNTFTDKIKNNIFSLILLFISLFIILKIRKIN
jgi:hypothetical protein